MSMIRCSLSFLISTGQQDAHVLGPWGRLPALCAEGFTGATIALQAARRARGRPWPVSWPGLAHPRHQCSEGPQHLPAGLFAASAGLAADPAVRVHLSVPLALVAA